MLWFGETPLYMDEIYAAFSRVPAKPEKPPASATEMIASAASEARRGGFSR
jgi:hypothetical protein